MTRILTPDFSQSRGSFLDAPATRAPRSGINIAYTEKLRQYLASQKKRDILIAAYRPHGHMAVSEENIQLIESSFADELIAKGVPYAVGELGRVLISNTWIPDQRNATIELGLSNWLGVKAITAKGLKRQDLLRPFAPILVSTDK